MRLIKNNLKHVTRNGMRTIKNNLNSIGVNTTPLIQNKSKHGASHTTNLIKNTTRHTTKNIVNVTMCKNVFVSHTSLIKNNLERGHLPVIMPTKTRYSYKGVDVM